MPLLARATVSAIVFVSSPAFAASDAVLNGASLSLFWVLPFAGILASLALFPMFAPHFWHRRQGLVALSWSLAFFLPFAAVFGFGAAFSELVHVLVLEYIPFIALVGALFTVAGGVYVGGDLRGSPGLNLIILVIGMVLASFAGTAGAAMILIRPLIRANTARKHSVHVVIFFIFLVCNVGGALTPLGDPPLFLGYLEGVDFFWPLKFLWPQMVFLSALLLVAFYGLDRYLFARDRAAGSEQPKGERLTVKGLVNIPFIVLLVAMVAVSGITHLGR